MNRDILQSLTDWKNSSKRKPLILKGARQVGKTYALEKFGENDFENTFYVNFEKEGQFRELFKKDLNPDRILNEISFSFKQQFNPETDLLIFDEIQACPNALTSLKYFCEDAPQVALCSAGSLLGLHLNDESFPVGKVDRMDLYPMSFKEFVASQDEPMLLKLIEECQLNSRTTDMAHEQLWALLKHYFVVGGLPEVVSTYIDNKDKPFDAFTKVRKKQEDIIQDYYADIAKHSGKVNAMHIDRVWKSVPSQMLKNLDSSANKFKFKDVVPGKNRYRQLAGTIDWLLNTGLLLKVNLVETAEQPLSAHAKESAFKLLMFDVGVLGAMSDLPPEAILKYDYGSYKGYFAENFICQELTCKDGRRLFNWQEKNSEVEFLKNIAGEIIPIEVKAGSVTNAKSLQVYTNKYEPPYRIIFSANKKSIEAKRQLYRLPLYLAGEINRLFRQEP